MKKINLKVRLKNPVFLMQVAAAILLPVLAYMGLTLQDMTSWPILGKTILKALSNPYIVGMIILSLFNAVNDPTTKGLTDSANALSYKNPYRSADKLNNETIDKYVSNTMEESTVKEDTDEFIDRLTDELIDKFSNKFINSSADKER